MWGQVFRSTGPSGAAQALHSAFRRAGRVACVCVAGLLAGMGSAIVAAGPAAAEELLTLDETRFACFDGAVALRIGEATTSTGVQRWVRERFESGSCLALPKGTQVSPARSARLSGRSVSRFQLPGSALWLIQPDWAMTPGPTETKQRFETMVPVTAALFEFAGKHMACLKEVTDLNARVEAHNRRYLELVGKDQEEGLSKTVIQFSPSEVAQEGARLNREVEDFRRRCEPYKTLEASTYFVDLMRERAGLPPVSTPTAA